MDHHHVERAADAPHRTYVAEEIETGFGQRRVDCVGTGYQEESVAVRRRVQRRFDSDVAAPAWPVLDDECLAQPVRQPLTHQPGDDVGRTAGSKTDEDADGARRIGLRPGRARHHRQCQRARCQMQKPTAWKRHGVLPDWNLDSDSSRCTHIGIMLLPDDLISNSTWERTMQLSERIGRRMKLQDLHVLMTVVQAGSMGKAAERLNTSQPNISRSIADLEHAFGVRLLDRHRQGVEPTKYGRALLDCGVAVFDDLRQGVKNIEFLADPTTGEV